MGDVTIEKLQLEVESSSANASKGIDALSSSLSALKTSIKGGLGLSSVARQITNLNTALNGISGDNASKIDRLASSLSKLSSLGQLKISSTIATQLKNIGEAASSLGSADFSGISRLATALEPLSGLQKASGLQNTITQLKKLPELTTTLNAINWTQFTSNIQKLSTALTPLATQLNTISNGFSRLPSTIRQTVTAANSLAKSNNTATKSYVNLWAKARMAYNLVRIGAQYVASWITSANKYIEDFNLFTVSMGEYAEEAYNYAQKVSEVMGIDPADWMRNQGVFNTIIEGFGVAGEKAAFMSKNLTQLGYDISSFYNITVEEAMTKIQSGISGELEPLRRLGYDLSVARLQQEALNLGITKSVSSMTQAEKSQLRYYSIMTQVTDAQGDMARTLTAPANQLRVLQAQLNLTARAFGNLFIPILNQVLPYVIALAKALRYLADSIASFFGIELATVDWSSLSVGSSTVGSLADNADDAASGLSDASSAAKKLKNNLLGIDELNIISPNTDTDSGSGSALSGLGGDLGIDLPGYDFLSDAVSTKIDSIVQKIKDHLQEILTLAGTIGSAILGWKLGKFLSDLGILKGGLKGILGLTLLIGGSVSYISGFVDGWTNNVDLSNMIEMIAGAVGVIAGLRIAFGALASSVGAAITGIGMFVLGIKDAIANGLNLMNGVLIPLGATLGGAGIGGIIGALVGSIGGPLGAAVGAAIGLAVGLVTDLVLFLYQNWDEVKAYFSELLTVTIPEYFQTMVDKAVGWVESLPEKIETAFNKVDEFFDNLPDKIDEALKKMKEKIQELPEKIETWFNDRTEDIKKYFDDMLNPIKEFDWKEFGKKLGKKAGETFGKIEDAFDDIKESLKKGFEKFFTETLPEFITEGLPKIKDSIVEFIENLPEEIDKVKDSIAEGFEKVGQAIWDGILDGWNTAITAVGDFIDGFIEGFKEGLGIHSPSTVFRDEIGEYLGEGILEGIAAPFETIGKWLDEHILSPIKKGLDENPIEAGINLVKNGWTTVSGWVEEHIGTKVEKAIDLIRNNWSTVADWVNTHIGTKVEKGIDLVRNTWTTVADWVKTHLGGVVQKGIDIIRNGWTTVADWVKTHIGGTVSKLISLGKDGWTTVSDWVSKFIGGPVSVGISLVKNGWNSIKDVLGLSTGGYDTGHGFKLFANGGYINGGKSSSWGIPMYANGALPTHGSMFVAGESGTEMVGRINGQTEVLNQSQIKLAMRSAVISGMAQFSPILSTINTNLVTCTNAVINSVLTGANAIYNGISATDTYDPSSALSRNTYEEASKAYSSAVNDGNVYSEMRDFYRDFVEATLRDIADDTRRTADKGDTINVQVGNRVITDAVDIQRNANGYSFAT